jgi:aspartate-semialdehyde dehydrogenase
MVILSHNTIRGAAGGSIYNAELLVKQGLLSSEKVSKAEA